jgi:drug/metabolite transporter (DMT)-like permease
VTFRKYLVLGAIVLLGSFGDVMISRGMKALAAGGEGISLHNWTSAISALFNPWVAAGTLLLICFLVGYSSALSWADLTFVLPATSFGYVIVALLAQFILNEPITLTRWMGILLVTGGVGFIAGGPSYTSKREREKIAAGER